MSCNPTTDSYLLIDGTFLKEDLFNFIWGPDLKGSVKHRANEGDLHVVDKFRRQTFTLDFPKLTQQEADALMAIIQQLGVNALHTVIYSTPEVVSKFDGVSLPLYNVNTNIGRVRQKVYFEDAVMPHWDNIANTYKCTIRCEEA